MFPAAVRKMAPSFLCVLFVHLLHYPARNKPPGTLKAKRLYMMEDLQRMARFHGVPLVPLTDKNAMYNTLGAQRCVRVCVCVVLGAEKRRAARRLQ